MARQVLILALVFFAIVGMTSAAAETAAEVATSTVPAEGPAGSDVIGTTDGGDQDAAPVGGPVASGAFPASTSSDAPTAAAASSASALQLSAAAGVAAAVAAFVFSTMA